ncbi:cellulase family glycosylhydrolase [Glycomyces xiaoerkulensis]|uniref:cellulase family glycosylhydrolase n=1 Tax=Glycomyces xiaoerkulensis TaxID=2038139 RepID=UPI000C264970|nr:cellulase family glycosylhydrolase [Glycomyces xiaoerkulensis]
MHNSTSSGRPARHRSARNWLLAAASALIVALAGLWQLAPAGAQQQGGFQIDGTQLVDANGEPFVMRGTSHPEVWFQQEFESIAEISDLGANTIRVVLGSGERDWGVTTPDRLRTIVDECKAQQVICVLEVHDTTGYGEQEGAASLDQAVDFWEGMYDVLDGEEAYTLINIGNEPWGNEDTAGWTQATVDAIERMRDIGFEHTLVVDAPNWGQDWEQIMLDDAEQVFAADQDANTLFSIHMYAVYSDPQTVVDYLDAFEAKGLPLIIGEYGDVFQGESVPWDTVQAEAQERGIGWIAWSYSGNSDGELDQVLDFDPGQMTTWGERVFDSRYGIGNTAERASVFGDQPPETTTPPDETTSPDDPTTTPGGEGDCSAEIDVVNDWGSGWQGDVTVAADQGDLSGWTLTWTWPGGQSISSHWNADLNQSGSQVTAGDVGWNGSIADGESRRVFGFIADNGAASPEVTCSAA